MAQEPLPKPADAQVAAEQKPTAAKDDGVAESLLLLQHLLRTTLGDGDTGARYQACKRARSIYEDVELRLTPSQRRTWTERMRTVFRRLPLPEKVAGEFGPTFHRVAGRRGVVDVSEAVTVGDYAAFLTDRKVPVDRIREQFYELPFLQGEGSHVTGVDRDAPVSGLSWHAAEAYRQWLGTRTKTTLRIPSSGDLPPGLRRTLWIGDRWTEPGPDRAELYRSYGGVPATLLLAGKPVGEFPEATLPGVQLHLSMSVDDARRLRLAAETVQ
jgi:hypothetical protein